MEAATPSTVRIIDGSAPAVLVIEGTFDAEAAASFEVAMTALRRAPRDLVIDVNAADRLDAEGLLLLADHASWLRRRSCVVTLRGSKRETEQLARLLGYERVLGLD